MLYTQTKPCDKRLFRNAVPRAGRKKVVAMSSVTIRQATIDDSRAVATMVLELLLEIAPESADTLSLDGLAGVSASLLADGQGVWAFLAVAGGGEAVGVLTLNECAALYAKGRFGEISELYVAPEWRSAKVGAKLIDAAVAFGRGCGWPLIEVGAPDQLKWRRSVDFYHGYGFTEVGPRLSLTL